MLPLLAYGELETEEERKLKSHLDQCIPCTEELVQIEKLHLLTDKNSAQKPSDQLLQEARMELRAALRAERSRSQSIPDKIRNWIPSIGYALGAAAMLVFGVFIGNRAADPAPGPDVTTAVKQETEMPQNMQITNVKFEDADASDGQIEFSFQAVAPMHYRGSINDPKIQKVLTYALVYEQNPGIRLHAANALNANQMRKPDSLVKHALIEALMKDENPGVRKEALNALKKFPADEEINNAFLRVLVHDQSPGLRVAAIKSLETERLRDPDVVDILKGMQTDENDFVRLNAKRLIQEVSQKQ